jgi:hypothetical protein
MKVNMSPKAIENRLKLVGELTKACLLIRQNSSVKNLQAKNTGDMNESASTNFLKRRTSRVK